MVWVSIATFVIPCCNVAAGASSLASRPAVFPKPLCWSIRPSPSSQNLKEIFLGAESSGSGLRFLTCKTFASRTSGARRKSSVSPFFVVFAGTETQTKEAEISSPSEASAEGPAPLLLTTETRVPSNGSPKAKKATQGNRRRAGEGADRDQKTLQLRKRFEEVAENGDLHLLIGEMWLEAKQKRVRPDSRTIDLAFQACRQRRDAQLLLDVLDDLEVLHGFRPAAHHYAKVIDTVSKAIDCTPERCLAVFARMSMRGFAPHKTTYVALLRSLLTDTHANAGAIVDVLERMHADKIIVSGAVKERVMEFAERARRLRGLQRRTAFWSLVETLRSNPDGAGAATPEITHGGLSKIGVPTKTPSKADKKTAESAPAASAAVPAVSPPAPVAHVSHDLKSYAASITKAIDKRDYTLANSLLEEMKHKGLTPNTLSYNGWMAAYNRTGAPAKALETWAAMREAGMPDNVYTLNILVDSLCASDKYPEALQLRDEFWSRNVTPNVVTYNTLIGDRAAKGDLVATATLLAEMKKANIAPTQVTYSVIVRGKAVAGDLDGARDTADEAMKDLTKPSERAYVLNCLLQALCNAGRVRDALALKDSACSPSAPCNRATYSLLISACSSASDSDPALQQALQALVDERKAVYGPAKAKAEAGVGVGAESASPQSESGSEVTAAPPAPARRRFFRRPRGQSKSRATAAVTVAAADA